jgi:hypothetical protein
VTALLKKIDACTGKNQSCKMGSFAVFCNDSEGLETQLKETAEKEKLEHCVLSIDTASGPKDYEIAKEAEVTVLLYAQHIVKANHAFKKGELKEKGIEKVLADVTKILPPKIDRAGIGLT